MTTKRKARDPRKAGEATAAARRMKRPQVAEGGGYGLPVEKRVFFERKIEDRFRNVWLRAQKKGYNALSHRAKRFLDEYLSTVAHRERFDADFFKDCLPELKRPDLKGFYHPGIRALPHGILIPPEIPPREYGFYTAQINALRRAHFEDTSFKRGRRAGSGYRMPPSLQKRIWKAFVRLVAGDDAARRSPDLTIELLKHEYTTSRKKMNWGAAERKLSKEFKLPVWKIRLAYPA